MWKYAYQVPENKKIRVIVHTDCKNEADDQFALAHHLMTPKFDVRGIVAGHFCKNPQEYGEENTAKASYDEVIRMMELMGIEGCLLYTSPSPQDAHESRMPSSA